MPVKSFSGLGTLVDKIASTPLVSPPVPTTHSSTLTVDHLTSLLNDPSILTNKNPSQLPSADLPKDLAELPLVAPRSNKSSVSITPDIEPQLFSQQSGLSPYETLYHDFKLEAIPSYNFWMPDELTNDREEKGDRKLEDIPRYIRILWDAAPDLRTINLSNVKYQNFRSLDPVKFGAQTENQVGQSAHGKSFLPAHLQPENFSMVVASLANGHIMPGIVTSNVEMPISNTDLDKNIDISSNSQNLIDEDAFLASRETDGLSIHELASNVDVFSDGINGAIRTADDKLSENATQSRDSLFNGNFSIVRSAINGDPLHIHGVQSFSPSMRIETSVVQGNSQIFESECLDLFNSVKEPSHVSASPDVLSNRVKFVDTSIGGTVSADKVNLIDQPHHAESTAAVAGVLPNLEVLARSGFHDKLLKLDMPNFPSFSNLPPVEYVGYVLEKYQGSSDGNFSLVDTIDLPSREYDEFVDTKVLYGKIYRYRLRSIVRWTHRMQVSGKIPSKLFVSSYFGSEWSKNWAYGMLIDTMPPDPPDELVVRPDSARKRVIVSFKIPNNPQQDLLSMRLLRKLQDSSGKDLTDWSQISDDYGVQNVSFVDTDVGYLQDTGHRYVYTAQCSTRHSEHSTLSEQLGCTLNRDYKFSGEDEVFFVSCSGVHIDQHGAFSVSPFKKTHSEIIVKPGGKFGPRARFSFQGRDTVSNSVSKDQLYLLRVESLDTGELQDIEIEATFNMQPDRETHVQQQISFPVSNLPAKLVLDGQPFGDLLFGPQPETGPDPTPADRPLPAGETSSRSSPS